MHKMSRRQLLAASVAGGLMTASSSLGARSTISQPRSGTKFVNFVKYSDLDRIAAARTEHFAYADRLREQGKLAIGGPLQDDRGRRIGLLFIYDAVSSEEALSLMENDPFAAANALHSFEISGWRVRGVNSELLARANRSGDRIGSDNPEIRLFANYAKYAADKSKLAAARPAHWEYDQKLKKAGKLALAGPFSGDTGGLFVYAATDRAEAMSIREQDPFFLDGVFGDYELLEWVIEGVKPELLTADPTFAKS